ncbi:MAG: hypothetical protein JWO03_2719 [Bacteroidetes bacterium]|nr:hypothetical protein [Bacteroidota bacterium]
MIGHIDKWRLKLHERLYNLLKVIDGFTLLRGENLNRKQCLALSIFDVVCYFHSVFFATLIYDEIPTFAQIKNQVRRVLIAVFVLLCVHAGFGQSSFYIGFKGGIDGCFYQYNAAPTSTYFNPNGTSQSSSTKLTSRGPAIPAVFELIYGIKNFRIGYQFEYERILTTAYTYKTFNVSQSIIDTTVNNPNITQHFFCHNILIEYIVYSQKHLQIVPDLTFGYFHGLSEATEAPYDFSSLNQNRFKIGVALNLEYQLGQVSVVATPHYGLVPVKSLYDPNQKGYMHFIGIHIGLRINCIKQQDPSADPAKKKKKQKEYVNPEDDN